MSSHSHLAHHTWHIHWSGIKPGPPWFELCD